MNYRVVKVTYESQDTVEESTLLVRRIITKLLIQEIKPPSDYVAKLLKQSEHGYRI